MNQLIVGPQTEFSEQLHQMKYRSQGESFIEAMNRMAGSLSDSPEHFRQLQRILQTQSFLGGGRTQAAVGSTRVVTAINCFVMPDIKDSYVDGENSIMDVAKKAAATMRMGGGVGYNFGTLRPKGDLIKKLDSYSSGPLSFMRIFNEVCLCTSSAGHRRGAQMGILPVWHPDIEEFIHAKQDNKSLTGFNISVAVTDEFMKAVEEDKGFTLRFDGREYRTVRAKDLWESIMRSTWDWAEPGIIFIDRINEMNNLWYCENISATNPCVPGDTLILTDNGYYPIEELVGETINIWNGTEFRPIKPYSTGFNETVVVNFSDGTSLRCTPTHRFLTVDGFKGAQDLVIGQRMTKYKMPFIEQGNDYSVDAYSQGFYSGDGSKGLTRSHLYSTKFCCEERLVGSFYTLKNDPERKIWNHGPMYDKDFVPITGNATYRLNWLAGLIDSDGCALYEINGTSFQISSINLKFLNEVRLMLTTLGVVAKVVKAHPERLMTIKGKEYLCKQGWRLLVNSFDAAYLMTLGLKLNRVNHDGQYPNRNASRFVTVVSIEDSIPCETFCFTEPTTGLGTFNGILTGQCGEQPLPPNGACLLGSFNLVKYLVRDNFFTYRFDWTRFIADIPPVVRAMDNIIDRTIYPLPEQKEEETTKRRMGLGVTGLANCIEAMGYSYGSKWFLLTEEAILSTLRNECYRASALLAKEKDPFNHFSYYDYIVSGFAKTLPIDIQELIYEHGIRNSHLTSIAPTGTISMCADNVSSGLEPVFSYSTSRSIQTPEGPRNVTVEDYGVKFLNVKGKLASQITADEHLNVLSVAQKYVDSAVSKTVNMDKTMPWEDFKNLYMKAWKSGCKGLSTFNSDGKRTALLTSSENNDSEPQCKIDFETGRKECG